MRKLFLTLLILGACSAETQEKPPNLLTKPQMVAFLVDSHMKDGQLQAARISRDSAGFLFKQIEVELYRQHGIDSQQFLASYHYYLEHVDDLADIYDAVIDSLSLREKVIINQSN